MEPGPGLGSLEGFRPLGQETPEDAGENVAAAPLGQTVTAAEVPELFFPLEDTGDPARL